MGHTHFMSRSAGTEQIWEERVSEPTRSPTLNGREIVHEKSHFSIREQNRELEPQQVESTENAKRLQTAMNHLHESGWYWGSITAAEAKQLLNKALDGAFLLRDSSNPGYLLTLSIKTALGTTHLRVEYSGGQFGFDSMVMARPHLRQFKGAVDLVQHYALASQQQTALRETETPNDSDAVSQPSTSETTLQLKLTRPLHKTPCSLQHLCRVAINQHSRSHQDLPLPDRLKDFLLDYPFVL